MNTRAAAAHDKRQHPRRRTRLRAGKLTDLADKFLTECTIFDVSDGGVGMLVPDQMELPEEMMLYDDLNQTIALVAVRWRKGKQLGASFEVPPADVKHFSAQRLRALQYSYYAVDPED